MKKHSVSRKDINYYTATRPIHPNEDRVISVREAARLSSFDDWLILPENIIRGMRLIGNTVPPRLAKAVIEAAIRVLN